MNKKKPFPHIDKKLKTSKNKELKKLPPEFIQIQKDIQELLTPEYVAECDAKAAKNPNRAVVAARLTGANTIKEKPHLYYKALALLGMGQTVLRTTQATGLSKEVVTAIRWRHPDLIDKQKKALAYSMVDHISDLVDTMTQKISEITPDKLAFSISQLTQAYQIISGEPTQTVNHNVTHNLADNFKDMLQSLPQHTQPQPHHTKNADVIDVSDASENSDNHPNP